MSNIPRTPQSLTDLRAHISRAGSDINTAGRELDRYLSALSAYNLVVSSSVKNNTSVEDGVPSRSREIQPTPVDEKAKEKISGIKKFWFKKRSLGTNAKVRKQSEELERLTMQLVIAQMDSLRNAAGRRVSNNEDSTMVKGGDKEVQAEKAVYSGKNSTNPGLITNYETQAIEFTGETSTKVTKTESSAVGTPTVPTVPACTSANGDPPEHCEVYSSNTRRETISTTFSSSSLSTIPYTDNTTAVTEIQSYRLYVPFLKISIELHSRSPPVYAVSVLLSKLAAIGIAYYCIPWKSLFDEILFLYSPLGRPTPWRCEIKDVPAETRERAVGEDCGPLKLAVDQLFQELDAFVQERSPFVQKPPPGILKLEPGVEIGLLVGDPRRRYGGLLHGSYDELDRDRARAWAQSRAVALALAGYKDLIWCQTREDAKRADRKAPDLLAAPKGLGEPKRVPYLSATLGRLWHPEPSSLLLLWAVVVLLLGLWWVYYYWYSVVKGRCRVKINRRGLYFVSASVGIVFIF